MAKLAEEGRFGQQWALPKVRGEDCRRGLPDQLVEGEREFSREISQLGEWLKKERSCSHNVSKNELLKGFFALLVALAERCMVRAELCRNEMQRKAWLKEADCALQRKTRLQQSSKYAASYVEKLIQWQVQLT